MTDIIDRYTRAPDRYHLLDGTAEMTMGVMFLFFAAAMWLSIRVTATWRWLLLTYGAIGVFCIVSTLATRYLRRKVVYPRSGYLKTRKRPWRLALLAFASFLLAVVVVLLFTGIKIDPAVVPLFLSFIIGVAFLIAGVVTCIRKFLLYAAISMGIGSVLRFTHPGFRPGVIGYYCLMGAALVVAGILTLYRYLHEKPEQNLEAE